MRIVRLNAHPQAVQGLNRPITLPNALAAAPDVQKIANELISRAWRLYPVSKDNKYSFHQISLLIDNDMRLNELSLSLGEEQYDNIMRAVHEELTRREEAVFGRRKNQLQPDDRSQHLKVLIQGKNWEVAKRALFNARPAADPCLGRVRRKITDQEAEDAFQQLWHAAHAGTYNDIETITELSPYKNEQGRYIKRLSEICTKIPDANANLSWDENTEALFFHHTIGHYKTTKMPQQIEVYRGVARADTELRPGDYVTLNRSYARSYIRGKYGAVLRNMVSTDDLIVFKITDFDFNELLYYPRNVKLDPQKVTPPMTFKQFWMETNGMQPQASVKNWYRLAQPTPPALPAMPPPTDLRQSGEVCWFEYHCYEGHDSADAQLWYRSHQRVTVVNIAKDIEPPFGSFRDRAENGTPVVYKIRFQDGTDGDAFEDELLDSRNEFSRPNPPKRKQAAKERPMMRGVGDKIVEDNRVPTVEVIRKAKEMYPEAKLRAGFLRYKAYREKLYRGDEGTTETSKFEGYCRRLIGDEGVDIKVTDAWKAYTDTLPRLKSDTTPLILYRGELASGQQGNYFTTDKEWARQFTQSGRNHEIRQIKVDPNLIYRAAVLPEASGVDDQIFDQTVAEAKRQGKKAIWVNEGQGQPNSVFIFDKSMINSVYRP